MMSFFNQTPSTKTGAVRIGRHRARTYSMKNEPYQWQVCFLLRDRPSVKCNKETFRRKVATSCTNKPAFPNKREASE